MKITDEINKYYNQWKTSSDYFKRNYAYNRLYMKLKKLTLAKIRLHYNKIYNYAEDIFHDIMLKVVKYDVNDKIKNIDFFYGWFIYVQETMILDFIKYKYREKRKIIIYKDDIDNLSHHIAINEYYQLEKTDYCHELISQFEKIEPTNIELLKEFYIYGYSYNEIADKNNVTTESIRGKMKRAKKKINSIYYDTILF